MLAVTVNHVLGVAATLTLIVYTLILRASLGQVKATQEQVGVMHEQILAMQHDRTTANIRSCKQATLEFARDISVHSEKARANLLKEFDSDGITTPEDIEKMVDAAHIELRSQTRMFLNELERLSAGCEMLIYDPETVDHLMNHVVRTWWRNTEYYIEYVRDQAKGGRQYECFQRLAVDMQKRFDDRNPPPPPPPPAPPVPY